MVCNLSVNCFPSLSAINVNYGYWAPRNSRLRWLTILDYLKFFRVIVHLNDLHTIYLRKIKRRR